MEFDVALRPFGRLLLRPGVAVIIAGALACVAFVSEIAAPPQDTPIEVVYVFAAAYVAWTTQRFAHHGTFAAAAALMHAAAGAVASSAPTPAPALTWKIVTHVVLFVGCAVIVAKVRGSMLLLAKLAATDDLTGATSRRHFITVLKRELTDLHDARKPHGVALIDLDRFRDVNNTHGHERGDAVLAACGAAMLSALGNRDVLGRIGGDEFAVLLRATDDEAEETAGRLRRAVLDVARAEGLDGVLGVSIGVATCHLPDGPSPHRLLARADQLMYEAKSIGGSAVVFEAFDGSPRAPARADDELDAMPGLVSFARGDGIRHQRGSVTEG